MKFTKGQVPWNKGIPATESTKEKLRKLCLGKEPWNKGKKFLEVTGEKNPKWKGDNVSRSALHQWLYRIKGKAFGCEECGRTDKRIKYEWANISMEYKRDVNDFRSLCTSCHRKESYLRGENNYYFKNVNPPEHKEGCKCFRCSRVPWNKGKKMKTPPWNKGKKTGLVPKTAFKKGEIPKGSVLFKKGMIPWNKK